MRDFLIKHKILLIVLAVILSGVYLFFALTPGYWYNDAFLAKQSDGSYSGDGHHGQYTLRFGENTITMTINNVTHIYEIHKNGEAITILRDGNELFSGTYRDGMLWDSDGSIAAENGSVFASGAASDTEDLFPNAGRIIGLSKPENLDTRGNPWMLALAWLFIAAWVLDILFPEFMFRFHVWGVVEGGTPGWRYEYRQYIRRIFLPIIAVIFLFVGFFPQ